MSSAEASPALSCERLWSQTMQSSAKGISYARESGRVFTWDDSDWLYSFSQAGTRDGQRKLSDLTGIAAAENGLAAVAVSKKGDLWWMGPDLTTRWHRILESSPTACAIHSLGDYCVAADTKGRTFLFDSRGKQTATFTSPRPLQHLAFAVEKAAVIGCADYGFVAAFDQKGDVIWRDGPVSHVGSICVGYGDAAVALACFGEGLRRYSLSGNKLDERKVNDPCHLVAQSYDGSLYATSDASSKVCFLGRKGQLLHRHKCDRSVVSLALGALGDELLVVLSGGSVVKLAVRAE